MIRPVFSPLLSCLAVVCAWSGSSACGGATHAAPVAHVTPPPSRGLGPNATFGELVEVARALDAADLGETPRRCLLGWASLDADLTVPLRPLPAPWADASTVLAAHPDGVHVFAWFGPRGDPSPITLVPFTRVRPAGDAAGVVALFLTPRGVWARADHELDDAPPGPVPITDVPAAFPLLAEPLTAVVVTADAATPLVRVRALLTRLARLHTTVALAVPLPFGEALATDALAADDRAASCPHGLPSAPGGTAAGELPATRTSSVITSWATAALACASHVTPPGDLTVDLRVAGDGTVALACAQVDTIGDAAVRRCILDVVRGSHFPPPAPLGAVVDLSYAFRLPQPDVSDAVTPLCVEH